HVYCVLDDTSPDDAQIQVVSPDGQKLQGKKRKIEEVLSLLLCYTVACRTQMRFGMNEWRGA
ncbi:MAG: hypothetical protein ABI406_21040, partial [Ktedonobacteraceae bacterium]